MFAADLDVSEPLELTAQMVSRDNAINDIRLELHTASKTSTSQAVYM
jgi:hypothetical protein